jgi:hypothetical protein
MSTCNKDIREPLDEQASVTFPCAEQHVTGHFSCHHAGGHLYHIRWVQDESGALKLQDYCKDPVSAVLASSSEGMAEGCDGGSSKGGSSAGEIERDGAGS